MGNNCGVFELLFFVGLVNWIGICNVVFGNTYRVSFELVLLELYYLLYLIKIVSLNFKYVVVLFVFKLLICFVLLFYRKNKY